MELTCNGCGKTFTARRSDARYCSPRCRTQAHRAKDAGPPRPRPQLPSQVDRAIWELDKAVARVERLSEDDRLPRQQRRETWGEHIAGISRRLDEALTRYK